jgi:hypothetical protein
METTKQVYDKPRNPKGKGGFQDHPELRSDGGWKKEMVFSYQYKRFMNMSAKDFIAFSDKIKAQDCTMVERAAYMRVKDMHKSLPDIKEITDRTEGKSKESVDITSNGETMAPVLVKFVDSDSE